MIISADMSFGYMALLGTVILFAGIGLAVSTVFLFRMFQAAGLIGQKEEYMEPDEYEYHGWEDPAMMPVRVERKAAHEREKIPVEYVEL